VIFLFIKSNIFTQASRNLDITYTEIAIAQAIDRFDEGSCLFLDTRSNFFYRMGHIKNALNFLIEDFNQIINNFEHKFPKNSKIVIYCDGLTCSSSYTLAKMLCKRGYFNIEVLFKGWEAWVNSSYPIEQCDERN
jgi:rhodanese-related sulfurtransferase